MTEKESGRNIYRILAFAAGVRLRWERQKSVAGFFF